MTKTRVFFVVAILFSAWVGLGIYQQVSLKREEERKTEERKQAFERDLPQLQSKVGGTASFLRKILHHDPSEHLPILGYQPSRDSVVGGTIIGAPIVGGPTNVVGGRIVHDRCWYIYPYLDGNKLVAGLGEPVTETEQEGVKVLTWKRGWEELKAASQYKAPDDVYAAIHQNYCQLKATVAAGVGIKAGLTRLEIVYPVSSRSNSVGLQVITRNRDEYKDSTTGEPGLRQLCEAEM